MTDRLLPLLLRVFGTSSLLATIFVAAPRAWMRDIHAALGLGAFPDTPVVWYLARSTSYDIWPWCCRSSVSPWASSTGQKDCRCSGRSGKVRWCWHSAWSC